MAAWIDWLTGKKEKSAGQAKDRLKLVLINDRTDLSPDMMAQMKDGILQVISHYIDIDPTAVSISVAQDGRQQRLMADIPLKPSRRKRIG